MQDGLTAEILELHGKGLGIKEITIKLSDKMSYGTYNQKYDRVRKRIERYKNQPYEPKEEKPLSPVRKASYEQKADGTIIQDKLIEICEEDSKSPKSLMLAHGFNPELWEVISYRNNYWHSQVKGGTRLVMYQSKIIVKPTGQKITTNHIDEYFANKDFTISKPLTTAKQYNPEGEILEIDLPDLHAGLLAWVKETGDNYDLHIVRDRFMECASDILFRCKGRRIKSIHLATLGDLLHFDNDQQTTTKGTFQQADGRLTKIFDFTLDLLIDFVTLLGDIAPTEVIYLPGNHDRVTGYMLLKAVEKAFRNDDNITFDTEPMPQKARLFGITLVGLTHGEMQKKNMVDWLQHKFKALYGKCKYAEVHSGHRHTLETKEAKREIIIDGEYGGIIMRTLPTIASASYWENHEGYLSALKTMMCFVWNEETGLREMWYSNIA